jgi:hypothetical protein
LSHGIAATGKGMPRRLWASKSRRSIRALAHECGHGAGVCWGGARIVRPRMKVCRMIIEPPQCGQTKHGFAALISASVS